MNAITGKRIKNLTFLLLAFLVGCSLPEGAVFQATTDTMAWIDVPVDGLVLPEVQPLQIEGAASGPAGIDRVEIHINGVLEFSIANPPIENGLARFSQPWTPPGVGEYELQAIAFGLDGSTSTPDTARVRIGEQAQTDVTVTPEQTGQSPVIEFWANPTEVTAGACTNFFWRTKNVKEVVFGGTVRPFEGQDSACPCSTQRYTLTVTMPDGSVEKRQVTVNVNGTCVTPIPVDTTPPPAPAPLKPVDGSTLSHCVASTTMKWNAVSDPSGIAEYQLQVQRHSGDFNWSTVSSPTGLGGTDTSVSVECGWYYRWRVRAVDGAGNSGPWSVWYTFTVPLI